ncbi:MAG: metalloprotease RseP [Polyangiaceae bacterium]|jgi:Zn-dependent protease|nr:metalloprotease RseP [Polyangiaceae bacterium]
MVAAMEGIPAYVALYLMFVFSTTCHEAAHAFAAQRGGDETASSLGHVTLDPTPHILRSPWGMVVMPIMGIIWMGFPLGWASVPYDPRWGRRYPLRQSLMSFSGPAANFGLALLSVVILRVLIEAGVYHLSGTGVHAGFVYLNEGVPQNSPLAAVAYLLSQLFMLNLLLGFFNLIPFPPLDGAGVAEGLSPRYIGSLYDRLREIPGHQFLGWIAASQLFPYLYTPMRHLIVLGLGF